MPALSLIGETLNGQVVIRTFKK